MHTLATRSLGIFCEKYLSKTTNTLLYSSTRVSPIAFKIFLRVPRCLGTSTAVITRLRQNAGSGRFSQIRSHILNKVAPCFAFYHSFVDTQILKWLVEHATFIFDKLIEWAYLSQRITSHCLLLINCDNVKEGANQLKALARHYIMKTN